MTLESLLGWVFDLAADGQRAPCFRPFGRAWKAPIHEIARFTKRACEVTALARVRPGLKQIAREPVSPLHQCRNMVFPFKNRCRRLWKTCKWQEFRMELEAPWSRWLRVIDRSPRSFPLPALRCVGKRKCLRCIAEADNGHLCARRLE